MALPILFGAAALASRFALPAIGRFASRALGGRLGLAATGAIVAGRPVAGAIGRFASRNRAPLAIGGAGAAGSLALRGGGAGAVIPSPQIVYGWNTGTAQFYRLSDGKIAAQRADGTFKIYRPYRPVCIPKRWNATSMRRVERSLKSQKKTAIAIVRLAGGKASS